MRGRVLAVAVLAAFSLSGCGAGGFNGIYALPLPGGADLGEQPYQVTIEFANVLDLVPQAGVKVNDVPVGRVDRIEVAPRDWTARVTVSVNGSVELPANARASVRQSSLLGEKFVELSEPAGGGTGKLTDGALIPLERSNRNAEVEEVFGALSLLLNGGGVGQMQQITSELNNALDGNEAGIRALLSNMDTFVGQLDTHRHEITRALEGVNRLSATLAGQRERIDEVLRDLEPGVEILARQRESLVTMLRSLDALSEVAVDTIDEAGADMVADLERLAPILRNLADAGKDLPEAFEMLLTFPFPDSAMEMFQGDYGNVFVDLDAAVPAGEPTEPGEPGGPVVPLRPMDSPALPGGEK
ncbi:MCE family protein [Amycolatopsis cihanbeyliensis]|uniref:Phospholipid/cholesterol/gamma-HCH transport system substrate-binding protein n=1 Tax=Amycolatopsis cihanbeyliensis TaxID=1128664 RepID=A0A542DMD5_AMYCI|nr:MCE family protein [Amycolatopsis cihanbeyliensis]TQJ04238.1 phospholipid/cholesterol/gamma-HCH transport system substrate-binding protein [Amycolatopsis cihanbeyliensis]